MYSALHSDQFTIIANSYSVIYRHTYNIIIVEDVNSSVMDHKAYTHILLQLHED